MVKTKSFIELFKFQLGYKLGPKRVSDYFHKVYKGKLTLLGSAIIAMILVCIIIVPYSFFMTLIYKVFSAQNDVNGFFNTIFVLNNMVLFISSLISVFTIMFSDKDRDILLPLPIKKHHIFLCNYLISYLSSILSSAVLLIPCMVIHFAFTGFSFFFFLKMLLCIIFFPALPSFAAYILMSGVLLISTKLRFKEAFAIIAGVLLVGSFMVLGYNEKLVNDLIVIGQKNVPLLSKILFNSFLFSKALNPGIQSVISLFLGIFISVLLLILLYVIGGFSFDLICDRMKNTSSKSLKSNINYKCSKVENAFLKKELKTILRSPAVALNCLLNIILAPIAAYIIYEKKDILVDLIGKLVGSVDIEFYILIIGIFVGLVIMSANMVPSTSISREGKCYWIIQTAPVSNKLQIKGRIKAAAFTYSICGIIYFILFGILLKLKILYIIYGLAVLLISSVSFSICGIIIDIKNPKLYWDRESEAVKQNVNGMIGILFSLILTIIYVVPFVLYYFEIINKIVTLLLIILLCSFSIVVLNNLLNKAISRKEAMYEG